VRVVLGRWAWLLAGSDGGGERAAATPSLIITAKLNDVDPGAPRWVRRWIDDHRVSHLDELLPWNLRNLGSVRSRRPLWPIINEDPFSSTFKAWLFFVHVARLMTSVNYGYLRRRID
jgi:hypothetical protein